MSGPNSDFNTEKFRASKTNKIRPIFRAESFFLALFEKTCLYQNTDVKEIELELQGWFQIMLVSYYFSEIGSDWFRGWFQIMLVSYYFSEITHLPKKF